jgi:hypothetical protein
MPRFFIEIPHEAERIACYKAVRVFLATGSHFLTHCDWGCKDGVHKAWITIDADSKQEAQRIIPPAFREQATIVEVGKFSLEEVDAALAQHLP